MIRVVQLVALVALISGCDAPPLTSENNTQCDDPTIRAWDCRIDKIVTTRLIAPEPYKIFGHKCTNCDIYACFALGAPCKVFGQACLSNGQIGICQACCEGTSEEPVGALRCATDVQTPPGQP